MSKSIKPINVKRIQELTKKNHDKKLNYILESRKTVIGRDIEARAYSGCNDCDVKFSKTAEVFPRDLDTIYLKLNEWCVQSGFKQIVTQDKVNPETRPCFYVQVFAPEKNATEQTDRIYHFYW